MINPQVTNEEDSPLSPPQKSEGVYNLTDDALNDPNFNPFENKNKLSNNMTADSNKNIDVSKEDVDNVDKELSPTSLPPLELVDLEQQQSQHRKCNRKRTPKDTTPEFEAAEKLIIEEEIKITKSQSPPDDEDMFELAPETLGDAAATEPGPDFLAFESEAANIAQELAKIDGSVEANSKNPSKPTLSSQPTTSSGPSKTSGCDSQVSCCWPRSSFCCISHFVTCIPNQA